jgi:hypothetical protein
MTSFAFLRGRSSGASSSKPFFPITCGGRRAPIDGPKPWSHMGAIASPEGRPPQRNDGNPRGLDDPLLPRGFDLVAGVTSRPTMSHSYLRLSSSSLYRCSNETDRLTRACAEPQVCQSLLIGARQWPHGSIIGSIKTTQNTCHPH